MHAVHIPQYVIDSVVERRGTPHPHADLDPRTTALIVVDLQKWLYDGGRGVFTMPHSG